MTFVEKYVSVSASGGTGRVATSVSCFGGLGQLYRVKVWAVSGPNISRQPAVKCFTSSGQCMIEGRGTVHNDMQSAQVRTAQQVYLLCSCCIYVSIIRIDTYVCSYVGLAKQSTQHAVQALWMYVRTNNCYTLLVHFYSRWTHTDNPSDDVYATNCWQPQDYKYRVTTATMSDISSFTPSSTPSSSPLWKSLFGQVQT